MDSKLQLVFFRRVVLNGTLLFGLLDSCYSIYTHFGLPLHSKQTYSATTFEYRANLLPKYTCSYVKAPYNPTYFRYKI